MNNAVAAHGLAPTASVIRSARVVPPAISRPLLMVAIIAPAVAGFLATGADASSSAVANAGVELTHLLRAMAGLKMLMAAGALAGILWRLGTGITHLRLAAYVIASAAMVAGPGLIWTMVHVGAGALLLHGGLVATALLLWRDPAVGERLSNLVAARRAALRAGH